MAKLRDNHKIMTVRRAGVAQGQCIRVTHAMFPNKADLARLVEALAVATGTKTG